ncbi:ATPase, T2SS/T4P/T4SS family [Desulfonatronovibrio magnus]|uniref:ATPase, T2SS/T4P/T4SS family n=1 Tax=Desulfonatronovibrio magnus TaxID=698827 RepID=UPI000A062B96|nr:ATPase, T2SS/T4P/T4SS family [Desulfonatronovibrio magnus]
MSGHLISIFSSKGGTGKSFIAANLAVNMHLDTREKVLLIDFGRPFSTDISFFLNLNNVKNLSKILSMADKITPNLLKGYSTSHSSGIQVLSFNSGFSCFHERVDPVAISKVISSLKTVYQYIVIDTGSYFDEAIESFFDHSSAVLIPMVPDYLSLRQTQNDLKLLQSKNFPRELIKVVYNKHEKNSLFDPDSLPTHIGRNVEATIPFDSEAASILLQGTYPEVQPRHQLTQALDKLVYLLVQHLRTVKKDNTNLLPPEKEEEIDLDAVKRSVHEKLLESIDFKKLDTEVGQNDEKAEDLKMTVSQKISEILDLDSPVKDRATRAIIVKEVMQEAMGLGPLEDMLVDSSISEIMVNAWNDIYVEKKGRLQRINKKFFSEQHLLNIITRITAPLGRKVDTSTPMVDARLKDGSRVNAIIPPLAVRGSCLTIRKFSEDTIGMPELLNFGTLNNQMVEFLKASVQAKLNILISGGTGSGKTTLLNILSSFIPEDDRIITIEDAAELSLRQPHVVTLESRPPNIEGKGEVVIRDLVKNSLRMRPDRIVVGECRGAEALDMLQAMNTGHDGSLTTIHSNSSREAISRLETLVLYAGFELPIKAIKEQIVGAIDIIVQISRFKDGSRKVIQVSEVDGMQGDVITLGDIFMYKQKGEEAGRVLGEFSATGYVPKCIERFEERGLHIPREVFWASN